MWPASFQAFQRSAGFSDGGLVAAVEQGEAAGIIAERVRGRAVGQEQEGRAVRVFLDGGQPDRLFFGVAVGRRAVGQEAVVAARRPPAPQGVVELLYPFLGAGLDHRPLAALQRPGEQLRQRVFQRRPQEMVEADLGHSLSGAFCPTPVGRV